MGTVEDMLLATAMRTCSGTWRPIWGSLGNCQSPSQLEYEVPNVAREARNCFFIIFFFHFLSSLIFSFRFLFFLTWDIINWARDNGLREHAVLREAAVPYIPCCASILVRARAWYYTLYNGWTLIVHHTSASIMNSSNPRIIITQSSRDVGET